MVKGYPTLCLIKHQDMKACGGAEVQLHLYSISVLDTEINLLANPTILQSCKETATLHIEGWVGPRACMHSMGKQRVSCLYKELNHNSLVIQSTT
jgi:hypothetical protein